MTNKQQLSKYCSLSKYLEYNSPKLFQAFNDLCLTYLLNPKGSGVTLLLPTDAAYIKEIFDGVYSTDPEKAVRMLKAIVIPGYFPSAASFEKGVVKNALGHIIEVTEVKGDTVHFKDKATAVLAKTYKALPRERGTEPMASNTAVYDLHGRISINGKPADTEQNPRTGGGCGVLSCAEPSYKEDMHLILKKKYKEFLSGLTQENIYVKKVQLHLQYLAHKGVTINELENYLGNDEISDSYLLDMFCEKNNCSDCFRVLTKALSIPLTPQKYNMENYIKCKESMLRGTNNNDNISRPPSVLSGLRNPIEVRERVLSLYKDNHEKLGRDLFIVFCNLSKVNWLNSPRFREDYFDQFEFIASKIYICHSKLLHQELEPQRDLTIYGNLLKSNVLNYSPQAKFTTQFGGVQVTRIPNPLEMKQYDLCQLVTTTPKVGGDVDHELEELLNLSCGM